MSERVVERGKEIAEEYLCRRETKSERWAVAELAHALALSEAEVKRLQERPAWFKRVFARLTREAT